MSVNNTEKSNLEDAEHLSVLGYEGSYRRSMSLWGNIALGFTYLSPLVAVYSLFAFSLTIGGPPSVFWIVIVGVGQLLVAFVMGEVVSQFPISGGIYPWTRRLWGKRYAWMAAWIYLWAMIVTITAVAEYGTGFALSLLGITVTPEATLLTAVGLLAIALVLNLGGTKVLSRVVRIGLTAELAGVVALGLYLLIFQRKNDFSVFFDTFGKGDGNYLSAFIGAALVGLFMFYGFEACGDVAEEVAEPSRRIPRAMYLTILVGGGSALLSYVGYVLAAPDLEAIVSGENTDPIPEILESSLGVVGAKIFLVIAVVAFISCILSLQAAASRLLHSFARDGMLPGSHWLARISPHTQIPTNALLGASVLPMLIALVVFIRPDSLYQVTAFAVLGIYIAFQAVVLASLRQRVKGWKPAGPFNLGRAGFVINVAALVYGIFAIYLLLIPGTSGDFVADYIAWIGLGSVVVIGALYLFIARPDKKSTGPSGDAIEVSNKIRAHFGA